MKFTFTPESRPLDGYTIKRAIYRGGFGEVYYALTDAGREVALKLLQNNTEVELRGVQQCLNLSHPNLVTIFDVRTDGDGDHWIIMEYVAGETLDAAIHRHPDGMPLEKVRQWLSGMSQGVGYLHERGIVHRDLKPGNVFSDEGVVKIGDVGLSKFITPSRRSAQTQSVGTVYYMAPEVANGKYGMEVDVYAMGIILYEMLTGSVPFEGESTGEILMKHLSEKPDLDKLPPRLRPVIGKALEKDPAARFATIVQSHEAFEQAAIGRYKPGEPAHAQTVPPQAAASQHTSAQPVGGHHNHEPRRPGHGHRHTPGHRHLQATETSPWRPTRRAFWLMLAAGLVLPWMGGARGEEGFALAIFVSWAIYLFYGLARSKGWEISHSFVQWMDSDSRPVSGWHWAGLFGTLLWITIPLTRARGHDLFEVGMPISIGMGCLGVLLSKVLPGAGKVDEWKQEINEEAAKIHSVARELERRTASVSSPPAPPRSPQRPPVSPTTPHYYRYQPVNPALSRKIPLRTRLMQFASAATLVVPITVLLSMAVTGFAPQLFASSVASQNVEFGGLVVSPALLGLFALTAIAASWVLLGVGKLTEGRKLHNGSRRLAQLAGGLVVGVVAATAADHLMIADAPPAMEMQPEMFQMGEDNALFVSIGEEPLTSNSGVPSLAGYLIFFAGLFALRRWWWHTDTFRSKRFRISSVLLTVLLAWLVSSIWAFPHLWAMTWAAVISSAVQLASVWTPPEERRITREV